MHVRSYDWPWSLSWVRGTREDDGGEGHMGCGEISVFIGAGPVVKRWELGFWKKLAELSNWQVVEEAVTEALQFFVVCFLCFF